MNELPKNFFKNEAKYMLWMLVAVILVAILAAILTPVLKMHLSIDKCLDAGGSYDHNTGKCVGASSE